MHRSVSLPHVSPPSHLTRNLWPADINWLNATRLCLFHRRRQGTFWKKQERKAGWGIVDSLKISTLTIDHKITPSILNQKEIFERTTSGVISNQWCCVSVSCWSRILLLSFHCHHALQFSWVFSLPFTHAHTFQSPRVYWKSAAKQRDLNVISQLQLNSFISTLERPTYFINVTSWPACTYACVYEHGPVIVLKWILVCMCV